jgi:hypothetical protein
MTVLATHAERRVPVKGRMFLPSIAIMPVLASYPSAYRTMISGSALLPGLTATELDQPGRHDCCRPVHILPAEYARWLRSGAHSKVEHRPYSSVRLSSMQPGGVRGAARHEAGRSGGDRPALSHQDLSGGRTPGPRRMGRPRSVAPSRPAARRDAAATRAGGVSDFPGEAPQPAALPHGWTLCWPGHAA